MAARAKRSDPRIQEALRHLDPPKGFKPWHGGPTTIGSLRGVTPELAAWRPHPGRHSIWSLALHVAYWNYAVWRRLRDGPRGGFPRSPSNFPEVPAEPSAAAWKRDRALLRDTHRDVVQAIRDFDAGRLDEVSGDGKITFSDLITGIVMHDTYHAGQIQMLKRLAASAGATD